MAGGVAGRGDKADLVRQAVVGLDQIIEPRRLHRRDGIAEDLGVALAGGMAGVGKFGLADQIAGAGEGGHPLVTFQHGVPADMIDVHMRAQDDIDILPPEARRRQPVEEIGLLHMAKTIGPGLVIAVAGIDDHPPRGRGYQQGLNREDDPMVRRDEGFAQPGDGIKLLWCRLGQERGHRQLRSGFDQSLDGDVANGPLHVQSSMKRAR